MNALRAKITILVMGAIIAMSIIGIAAAMSVTVLLNENSNIVFRYAPATAQHTVDKDQSVEFEPFGVSSQSMVLGYAFLIVAGSATVGLIVANMVARPLSILEEAVNSVDPEGFIPRIDERGLGEDLEAAKLINRLSERLKLAMESRMRLVAAAGHDLRTPMTRMRLRLEFLEDNEEKELWARDIDEMTHIADSAIRLVREESGAMETEIIEIDRLTADLCSELREIGHNVEDIFLAQSFVQGGYHSLKRAVSNLIVNAATHGGKAEVLLTSDDDTVYLVISDDGPGIPEEMLVRAFEPFFRAEPARQKNTPGAGLGLAIAKEIVTRHGGSLSLANNPAGGLVQTIRLPSVV